MVSQSNRGEQIKIHNSMLLSTPCIPVDEQQVQVAAALAIISTKPEGVSAEVHVKFLADKLKASHSTEEQDLQKEIIRLKQLLTLHDLQVNADMVLPSHAGLPMISYEGCPAISEANSEPITIALPDHNGYEELENHYCFIQGIIHLYSILVKSSNHNEAIAWNNHTNNVVIITLKEIIGFLIDDSGLTLPEKMWDDLLNKISCLLTMVLNKLFQSDFAELCTNCIKKILDDIMAFHALDQFQYQARRTSLILTLSKNKDVCEKVIQLFLEAIERYASYLQNTIDNNEAFSPRSFENMNYVFETVEKLLNMYQAVPHEWVRLSSDLPNQTTCQIWLHALDMSLQLTAHLFPLFTTYTWHLRAVLYKLLNKWKK